MLSPPPSAARRRLTEHLNRLVVVAHPVQGHRLEVGVRGLVVLDVFHVVLVERPVGLTVAGGVETHLGGCLADFGLLEKGRKSTRNITPIHIHSFTSLFLTHELHFSGYGDDGVLQNPDWQLFGLEKLEIVRELQRVSNDHFILQFSGELVRISWKYKSIEEAIRTIARSEF